MNFDFILDNLSDSTNQGRYRQRQLIENNGGREITVSGKDYINFSSNDYLGLNGYDKLNAAYHKGIDLFGTSSSSSSLVTGYQQVHQDLEQAICHWLDMPACMLFTSGFSANSGLLSALANNDCHFVLDKLSHASLIDGALQAKSTANTKISRFKHNDVSHLEKKINSHCANQLIVTEGVFSMDGDRAPLNEIQAIQEKYHCSLLVDDAHALGVLGDKGQGSREHIVQKDTMIVGTFGKAIASSGAFVTGSSQLIEYLTNYCRHYIYSTAMAPAQAFATIESIYLCQQEQWRRDKLVDLQQLFRKELKDSIEVTESSSPIFGIIVGDENKTLQISNQLKKYGIWLSAIRPPTVPNGTSRLRVTITAKHDINDIKKLAKKLNELIN